MNSIFLFYNVSKRTLKYLGKYCSRFITTYSVSLESNTILDTP